MNQILHYIDGESVASISGKTFLSENPATEETIAEVAFGEAEDVDAAVESADEAFQIWKNFAPLERGKLLYKVADKLLERREDFALAESARKRLFDQPPSRGVFGVTLRQRPQSVQVIR